ncbi:hypothetical protein ACKVWC_003695 [Pyricularia oryzae]
MLSYENPTPAAPSASTAAEKLATSLSSSATASKVSGSVPDNSVSQSSMASTMKATGSSASAASNSASDRSAAHIWLVTGPAGCGKSTVAQHLATSLDVPYIEGDEYHPPANIEKMSNGIPLTDMDRWDWLILLRDEALRRLGEGGSDTKGVVVTCSALKRKYRDVIRVARYFEPSVHVHFIYLAATEEALLERVARRQNHYMGANMVRSQFQDLEPPRPDETDIISIDVSGTLDDVKTSALDKVREVMAADQ